MFDRECLDKEVDGKRLKLISANQVTRINGLEIITEASDEYWYCSKIDNNTKVDFAEYIVPTFEKEKFVNFKPIFSMISDILEEI